MRLSDQVDLILKARDGDVHARNELIETNLPFIRYVIAKYAGRGAVDEYLSDGVLGFIKAIERFDLAKVKSHVGSTFWSRIRYAILDTIRAERAEVRRIVRYQKCLTEPSSSIDQFELEDELEDLWGALYVLSDRERIILTESFSGVCLWELAERFGISKSRASQIKCRALARLREQFHP